jgi:hypothetical protein
LPSDPLKRIEAILMFAQSIIAEDDRMMPLGLEAAAEVLHYQRVTTLGRVRR